jgi:hypothetical protein
MRLIKYRTHNGTIPTRSEEPHSTTTVTIPTRLRDYARAEKISLSRTLAALLEQDFAEKDNRIEKSSYLELTQEEATEKLRRRIIAGTPLRDGGAITVTALKSWCRSHSAPRFTDEDLENVLIELLDAEKLILVMRPKKRRKSTQKYFFITTPGADLESPGLDEYEDVIRNTPEMSQVPWDFIPSEELKF